MRPHAVSTPKLAALALLCLASFIAGCSRYDSAREAFESKEYALAFQRWKRLAEFGDARAQNDIGYLYEHGLGVSQNAAEAFRWYRAAAETGLAPAQNNLGLAYLNGVGTRPDP